VEITGHQWWWEAEYWDAVPSQRVRTANEIHLPVGEPVLVRLRSADVIHSFWVPALHGKRDLIPGHDSSLWIQADRAGTFGGQCAEFCGYQHAHMRLLVVAESRGAFDGWLARQRQPAPEPGDDRTRHGRDVFLSGPCVLCHAISGTPAAARPGGLLGLLGAVNHKTVAGRYLVSAFVFFGLGGVLALLMRLQLAFPEARLLGPDLYDQVFTVHGSTMMFLFAVPVMEAMGLYLVPLMIGTRNVAFPRLNAFGYWSYLIGGLFLWVG